jgi:hypothetical protein
MNTYKRRALVYIGVAKTVGRKWSLCKRGHRKEKDPMSGAQALTLFSHFVSLLFPKQPFQMG